MASPFSDASLLSSASPFSAGESSGASSVPFSLPLLSAASTFLAGDFLTGDSFGSVEVTSSGATSL